MLMHKGGNSLHWSDVTWRDLESGSKYDFIDWNGKS